MDVTCLNKVLLFGLLIETACFCVFFLCSLLSGDDFIFVGEWYTWCRLMHVTDFYSDLY